MKPELFDVLVDLPPSHSKNAASRAYPTISVSSPLVDKKPSQRTELKATQRDVRRYIALRKGLRRVFKDECTRSDSDADDSSDAASTFSSSPIVEPLSWTRLAYTSFIWWASAGEKRDGFSEEEEEEHEVEQDARLLASVDNIPSPPSGSTRQPNMQQEQTPTQPPEIALIAYFRQLTTQIFVTLSDVIARQDDHSGNDPEPDNTISNEDQVENTETFTDDIPDEDPSAEDDTSPLLDPSRDSQVKAQSRGTDAIIINAEDMAEMGLDTWSAADRIFVEELVLTWWGRKAYVDSARIRCCGISII
jgi:hypothetical protein